jgi:hypothetical protein
MGPPRYLYRNMSQLLRMKNHMIHVPSVARTRLYASPFLGRPCLLVVNHDGYERILQYKVQEWDLALLDFKKCEASRAACATALKSVPLMEQAETYNPLVESERSH